MKNRLLLLTLLMGLSAISFTACSDDDDDVKTSDVPQAVMTAFQAKFPAAAAKWEREGGLLKAEFINAGRETDAFFTTDGTWVRTETDLFPTDLPETVRTYLAANYPDWAIDDADLIETPESTWYRVELDKPGFPDVHLRFASDGTRL
ncbi:MAG: PepSY-like domain-containing protein [Bacteroidaceae bacterium]|nr:PepSY-like domain-containing protein [Bacteroidaceae bacterium]